MPVLASLIAAVRKDVAEVANTVVVAKKTSTTSPLQFKCTACIAE